MFENLLLRGDISIVLVGFMPFLSTRQLVGESVVGRLLRLWVPTSPVSRAFPQRMDYRLPSYQLWKVDPEARTAVAPYGCLDLVLREAATF
jgi:hypothetical protein